MSKTPVVTSVEVNVIVASHLSNLPAMATEAFTLNPIELFALSNSKTGIPVGACGHAAAVVKTNRIVNPIDQLVFFMVFSVKDLLRFQKSLRCAYSSRDSNCFGARRPVRQPKIRRVSSTHSAR